MSQQPRLSCFTKLCQSTDPLKTLYFISQPLFITNNHPLQVSRVHTVRNCNCHSMSAFNWQIYINQTVHSAIQHSNRLNLKAVSTLLHLRYFKLYRYLCPLIIDSYVPSIVQLLHGRHCSFSHYVYVTLCGSCQLT